MFCQKTLCLPNKYHMVLKVDLWIPFPSLFSKNVKLCIDIITTLDQILHLDIQKKKNVGFLPPLKCVHVGSPLG